tara:strand:+ start:2048 stop:3217 length:1170 start_codon:yes stop_codon:yes gene_type:complete
MKTMRGGKLVAEGGYGCIFTPGINCDGSIMKSKKYASKIQRYDSSAKNEIEIGKILQELNGFEDHFSPVLKHCTIDVAKIKDDEKNKCTVLKKHKARNFIVMKLQYIKGVDFIDYLIKQKNSVQLVNNIILSYNHLLKSISMMIKKKCMHFDIKGTNILFDSDKEHPLLIDFGLSAQISKINKNTYKKIFYVYAPQYYVWSLEIHYINYLINKNENPTLEELREISKTFVDNNRGVQKLFSPDFLKKYEDKCFKQLNKYNKIPLENRIEKILEYWKTFDNYSLSIMYLRFLHYININGFIDNEFIIFLGKLLLKNIDPNPENRLSIVETIHTFNAFLYQKNLNNVKTFEELTNNFIKNKKDINDAMTIGKKTEIKTMKTMRIIKRKQNN